MLLALCLPGADGADPTPAPLVDLPAILARATHMGLHRDPYWLTLLHYRGRRSTIDDPAFFLSPDGVRDPRAELVATLTGMVRGDAPGQPDAAHPGVGQPVSARFPARSDWLCGRLGIAPALLPVDGAALVDAELAAIEPRGATLVLASGYLRSPASMFGHTLLLLRGRADSPLLAQGINYAAQVPIGRGDPLSALKGLFGSYRGLFTVLPYHRKVQEYADLDQRDLWEYELALSPQDVRRMLLHAWELRGIWSSYWFLDENCSYSLACLLDAARPGLALSQRAGMWVLPVDTVRWVRDAGLIRDVVYRPSLASRVRASRAALGPGRARIATGIARGTIAPEVAAAAEADPATRAQVLDLAGEVLHALAGRHAIDPRSYRVRLHATLGQRAALGRQPPLPAPLPPPAPHTGHATRRFGLGGGLDHGQAFASLSLRPALHDLADAPDGYLEGSRVAVADAELRWYHGERPALHRLDVIGLTALNPWDDVVRRWSWAMTAGTLRERMGEEDEDFRTHARLDGGVGIAARFGGRGLAWGLVGGDARGFHGGEGWALGPSATLGASWRLPRLQLVVTGTATEYLLGEEDSAWSTAASLRTAPAVPIAFDLSYGYRNRWDVTASEVAGTLFVHF